MKTFWEFLTERYDKNVPYTAPKAQQGGQLLPGQADENISMQQTIQNSEYILRHLYNIKKSFDIQDIPTAITATNSLIDDIKARKIIIPKSIQNNLVAFVAQITQQQITQQNFKKISNDLNEIITMLQQITQQRAA